MNHRFLLIALASLSLVASCNNEDKPVIETFQCTNTSWDNNLSKEMRQQAALYPQYEFRFHDTALTAAEEAGQIENAILRHPDVIIVNPYDEETLLPVIEKAFDSGIPVVLVGQKLATYKYSSFVGCNNNALGRKAIEKVSSMLPNGGNIIVIDAFDSSSETKIPPYYKERRSSFMHGLNNHPDIRLLATYNAGWDKEKAHAAADTLKAQLGDTPVDLVFSFGYEMLQGVKESMNWPDAKYIGMEGVPGDALLDIISGEIDATFVSPTGGAEAINTSISIAGGLNYVKDNNIDPFYIDASNASAYHLLSSNIAHTGTKIDSLSESVNENMKKLSTMRILAMLFLVLLILAVVAALLLLNHWMAFKERYKALDKTNSELETLNKNLAIRCEVSERINRLLESEKNTILDVVNESPSVVVKDNDPVNSAVFMNRFRNIVNESIGDSDLSVETVASRMNMSRAQLFRRVKADTGMSPNEMILEIRLNKAREFFTNTDLSVSEVAYSTGFASPSYFSKCFKDRFGVSPKESKK